MAQGMVLSHHAKLQFIINFFRVKAISTGLFVQNTFLKHHVRTRQQTMIEKRTITFKRNSRLSFFDSLRNCWPPTAAVHKCDAIICLINTPLRMCRGIVV